MSEDILANDIQVSEEQGHVSIVIPLDKDIGYNDVLGFVKTLGLTEVDYPALKQAHNESRGESVRIGVKGEVEAASPQFGDAIGVEISEDGQAACVILDFEMSGQTVTYRSIMEKLKATGVVRGFITENIQNAVEKKTANKKIKVAEGIPPMDGMDAEFTFHYPLYRDLLSCLLEAGPDIPLEDINFIHKVAKGDLILSKSPPVKGVPGCKVTGEKVPYREGKDMVVEQNPDLVISPDGGKAVAAKDGQLIIDEEGRVTIRPLLILKKTSGDKKIKFDGSVVVEGDLDYCPGIIAMGDIEVNGANQNVPVTARGNILIKGPFLLYGGKEARAARDFACDTTNNTHISARNIYVAKAASQVVFEAEEEVHTNIKEGRIIGGEIQAGKKAVVGELGNKKETATLVKISTHEIQAKYNSLMKEKLEKICQKKKEEFESAKQGYLKIDEERRALEGKELPPGFEKKAKSAKEKKDALQKELDELKTQLVQRKSFKPDNKTGEVECQSVHAGVRLEMGESVREIKSPIDSPVRFLKRAVGIVTEMKDRIRKEEKKTGEES